MDGYITKRLYGHFSYPMELSSNVYANSTDFYFTQWYNAKLNKSLFLVDKIYVSSFHTYQYAYKVEGGSSTSENENIPVGYGYPVNQSEKLYFDGKIKINGTVVYTASKSSEDTYIQCSDSERIESIKNIYSRENYIYNIPVRTTKTKNSNGEDAVLSFGFEVDHNEDRTGKIKIELVKNTSTSFYLLHRYYGSLNKGNYSSTSFAEGISIEVYSGADDTESNYYTSTYDGNILLEGATIQNLISAADVTAGQECSIQIDSIQGYYYKIELVCRDWSMLDGCTSENSTFDENGIPKSYYGIMPLEALNHIPDTPKEKMKAILWTYLDEGCTNPVGDSEPVYFYISVPSDAIPSITDSTATVIFTNEDYNIGEAISELSYVNLLASAEGIYGSWIDKFIIQGAYSTEIESSGLNYTGDIIKTNGLKEFTIIAVDSRGMQSESKQYFIQFYKYDKPKILTFDVGRVSGDDTSISVRSGWEITLINGKNSSVGIIKFKKKNEAAWRTLCEIANNPTEFVTVANPDDADGLWDKYYSYEFMLVVQDLTKNYAESIKFVPTIKTIMDFKEPETKEGIGGVGIGKTCELENFVEIWLNAKLYNDVYIGDDTLAEYIAKTMRIQVSNVVISKDDFEEYYPVLSSEYPYRIAVPIDGVNSEMMPEVLFSFDDSRDGNFAQFSDTYDGGVYLYANAIPSASVTIPYIICRR